MLQKMRLKASKVLFDASIWLRHKHFEWLGGLLFDISARQYELWITKEQFEYQKSKQTEFLLGEGKGW